MRIYTCIFKKDGKIVVEGITGPFDRIPAIEHANSKLKLSEHDELYALIPGQHTEKAWIINEKSGKEKSCCGAKFKSAIRDSGVSLSEYVPNGF